MDHAFKRTYFVIKFFKIVSLFLSWLADFYMVFTKYEVWITYLNTLGMCVCLFKHKLWIMVVKDLAAVSIHQCDAAGANTNAAEN